MQRYTPIREHCANLAVSINNAGKIIACFLVFACRLAEIPFSAVQRFALRAKFLHSESPAALEFGSLACRVSFCGGKQYRLLRFCFFGDARLMSLIKIVCPYEHREIRVGDVDLPEVCFRCLPVIDKSIGKISEGC